MATISLKYGSKVTDPALAGDGKGYDYNSWEAETMHACVCDDGYAGGDCSLREGHCMVVTVLGEAKSPDPLLYQACVRWVTTTALPTMRITTFGFHSQMTTVIRRELLVCGLTDIVASHLCRIRQFPQLRRLTVLPKRVPLEALL